MFCSLEIICRLLIRRFRCQKHTALIIAGAVDAVRLRKPTYTIEMEFQMKCKCVHSDICPHRLKLQEAFRGIVDIHFGGRNPQVEAQSNQLKKNEILDILALCIYYI